MGWLKPAESLLEPKSEWVDAHRDAPPDGPVPEPPVAAAGTTVHGICICSAGAKQVEALDTEERLWRDSVEEKMVVDERTFDFVPVALLLGVPLMFKRLSLTRRAPRPPPHPRTASCGTRRRCTCTN